MKRPYGPVICGIKKEAQREQIRSDPCTFLQNSSPMQGQEQMEAQAHLEAQQRAAQQMEAQARLEAQQRAAQQRALPPHYDDVNPVMQAQEFSVRSRPTQRDPPGTPPPVWGSIERNTGAFCPFCENQLIEDAYQSGRVSIFLPTCFNATVHFDRGGGAHHQSTPAVGSKPAGRRSVSRGVAGAQLDIFWWPAESAWRLDAPPAMVDPRRKTVLVTAGAPLDHEVRWQWCDLPADAVGRAVEANWHGYDDESHEKIEEAWARGRPAKLLAGLSQYEVANFQGTYATQVNLATGFRRVVRRGIYKPASPDAAPADLEGDCCALCTENFSDTPQWPVTRTSCRHAFHFTCLNQLRARQGAMARRCPVCRTQL